MSVRKIYQTKFGRPPAPIKDPDRLQCIIRGNDNLPKQRIRPWKVIPRISKIIHQTWKNSSIPSMAKNWVKKWLRINPGWEYWFWSDDDCRTFIKTKFPNYLQLYDGYDKSIQKADVIRYFILYEYGGIYADLDVEPLRPLHPITEKFPCVLSQEPDEHAKLLRPQFLNEFNQLACNAFMACRPHHPFFDYVIQNLESAQKESNITLFRTGPAMISTVHAKYIKERSKHICENEDDKVIVAHPAMFTPTFDTLQMKNIANKCAKKEVLPDLGNEVCKNLILRYFSNQPTDKSFTNHHWFHTWTKRGRKYFPRAGYPIIPIKQVVPEVKFAGEVFEKRTESQ
ncbi:uncharacterized protein LOC135494083 [Lineus longissimus]|uniref:uncharacterized protein LOC135494083 n=1 Tax=Lineus longissimus TaxID=88925 RepID=UPI00315C9F64